MVSVPAKHCCLPKGLQTWACLYSRVLEWPEILHGLESSTNIIDKASKKKSQNSSNTIAYAYQARTVFQALFCVVQKYSFHLYNNPISRDYYCLSSWRSWGTERLSNWTKVTRPLRWQSWNPDLGSWAPEATHSREHCLATLLETKFSRTPS